MSEVRMTPDEFMALYERTTGLHDLEGTLALIAEDAVYLFSDSSSHIGKPQIRTVLANNFNAISNERYQLTNLRWLAISQPLAICIYEFNWSGEIEGTPRSGHGRGTTALRRTGEGWLVLHEHLSAGKI
jgi:ketosteroid isomerase-like protein